MSKKKKKPIKPRSKWWHYLVAMLPGVLILLAAEGVLRLAGFGYPTSFFVPGRAGFVETNMRFAWRFMSPELAREPLMVQMAERKPPGAVRIFILGESAAQGFPDGAFGFGRILEVMLRARHPGTKFEVVNTAMTAINSHGVREIAKECLRYEPDLFLLYCGNNEVVGPFGPGSVFQSDVPPLGLIRLQLQMSRLRLWQALTRLTTALLSNSSPPKQWVGMEMFLDRKVGSDDPRLEKVYAHFRANITDILQAARRHGVPLVACTVPVNLEACSPFASQHRLGWTDADEKKWSVSFAAGTNAEARGEWALAEKHYAAAAALDSRFAELDYRRAHCFAALGRPEISAQAFAAARDHDALRFRTDSRLNALVRDLTRAGGPQIRLYDAEADFAEHRDELFHEHVHLTFSGNYLLAQGFLKQVEAALPLPGAAASNTNAVPSEEECVRRLAYTPWSRLKAVTAIMNVRHRPPFTLQYDHQQTFPEQSRLFKEESQVVSTPEALQQSIAAYDLALQEQPGDWFLRANLVELLDRRGDYERAVREARKLATEQAGYIRPKLRLGDELLRAGQLDEAVRIYREVIQAWPEMGEAYQSLGDALLEAGRNEEALAAYQQALSLGRDTPELHNNLGGVLLKKGDLAGAETHLRSALKWTDDPIWHANLAGVLFNLQKFEAALPEFQKALAGAPANAALRDNLGLTLLALGRKGEAIAQFEEALRIDPGFEKARQDLQQAQGLR